MNLPTFFIKVDGCQTRHPYPQPFPTPLATPLGIDIVIQERIYQMLNFAHASSHIQAI